METVTEIPKKKELILSELLESDIFRTKVKDQLRELLNQRRTRSEPQKGFSYKRDWYDRMNFKQLTAEFFISHYVEIIQKKSSLSSEFRMVIKYVCDAALVETIKHFQTAD